MFSVPRLQFVLKMPRKAAVQQAAPTVSSDAVGNVTVGLFQVPE